ncbi:PaaI family thioesterase [Actinomadura sp. DC4]|uniref:PaaI family thioesterase n=1 Tax=Actinomadura sp. DC4 TaxID=3055069 RepID=UPI0025B11CE9|nr:PaaI family thioesterase [Actinomadura sp. DC4]MDN3358322.1 PaaI family thioesterase [Actinomadura sp. DC4]
MTSVIEEAIVATGLEQISALLGERAPGIASLLDMSLEVLEPGRVVFTLETRPDLGNPLGTLHGGVCSTLLDSAMACSVHASLPEGTAGYTTLELKVNFIRPVRLDGVKLRCEGTTIHLGGRIATTEGRVTDDQGRLVAHGTSTCMVFSAA